MLMDCGDSVFVESNTAQGISHSHTHSFNPMTTRTQVQDDQAFDEELTDQELESINGGFYSALSVLSEDKMESILRGFLILFGIDN